MDLKQVAKHNDLKGTFLDDLLVAMAEGKGDNNTNELEESDRVIGTLNRMEKALDFLRKTYTDQIEALLGSINADAVESIDSEDGEAVKLAFKLDSLHGRRKIAHNLFWSSLKERFSDVYDSEVWGLAIRKDDQVVHMYGNDDDDDIFGGVSFSIIGSPFPFN